MTISRQSSRLYKQMSHGEKDRFPRRDPNPGQSVITSGRPSVHRKVPYLHKVQIFVSNYFVRIFIYFYVSRVSPNTCSDCEIGTWGICNSRTVSGKKRGCSATPVCCVYLPLFVTPSPACLQGAPEFVAKWLFDHALCQPQKRLDSWAGLKWLPLLWSTRPHDSTNTVYS